MYRFDGATLRFHAFPSVDATRDHFGYSVTGVHDANRGRVWIATYNAVIGFDGDEFLVIDDESLGHTPETGFLHVRSVFEDSKGRLWIGNNGIGVIMCDGESTINFTQAHGLGEEADPSLHRVFAIGEDRDGNIWFGTRDHGAWRFDGASLRQFTERDGLQTGGVFAITTDRNGDLWLGGEGVFKFNGKTFEKAF